MQRSSSDQQNQFATTLMFGIPPFSSLALFTSACQLVTLLGALTLFPVTLLPKPKYSMVCPTHIIPRWTISGTMKLMNRSRWHFISLTCIGVSTQWRGSRSRRVYCTRLFRSLLGTTTNGNITEPATMHESINVGKASDGAVVVVTEVCIRWVTTWTRQLFFRKWRIVFVTHSGCCSIRCGWADQQRKTTKCLLPFSACPSYTWCLRHIFDLVIWATPNKWQATLSLINILNKP